MINRVQEKLNKRECGSAINQKIVKKGFAQIPPTDLRLTKGDTFEESFLSFLVVVFFYFGSFLIRNRELI